MTKTNEAATEEAADAPLPFIRRPEAVAPIAANRFYIAAGDRVRIAFGEAGAGGDIYHQAVSLSRADALELAGTLATLLVDTTAKADQPEPTAAAPSP